MSPPVQADRAAFRAAYRALVDELLRLTEGDPAARIVLLQQLLDAPLVFPASFRNRSPFAPAQRRFLSLFEGVTDDIGALEAVARDELEAAHVRLTGAKQTAESGGPWQRTEAAIGTMSHTRKSDKPAARSAQPGLLDATEPEPHSDGVGLEFEPVVAPSPAPALGGAAYEAAAAPADSPAAAGPSAAPPPSPAEARFLNAAIADHDAKQPLEIGQPYVLEFGVGLAPSGDASAPVRIPDANVLYAPDENVIELTVSLTSSDFDVEQGPLTLKLPRKGASRGKARFDITPLKEGRGTLTATIHKQGNFLLQMELTYSIGTATAASAPSAFAHGRTLNAAAGLEPRELGLAIRPAAAGTYDCTVWGTVTTRVSLPLTDALVADAISEARQALMSVIMQRDEHAALVFQTGIDIDAASEAKALNTLARAGATLFQRIFHGPLAGPEVRQLGDFLARRASQPGRQLRLQIVAERFPIPWGLLYFGRIAGGAALDWNLFLGMRHVIEQIPLQVDLSVDDPSIPSDPTLAVSVNVHAGIDQQMRADFVQRQLVFWNECAVAHGAQLQVAQRTRRAELLAALSEASDQLIYLYCHAVTSNPGDAGGINASHFVLTGGERLTLGDLNLEAPMSAKLPGSPLIFINACESAELTPAFYDGFVPYFMGKGARGVIGTECKTPALFATEWALRFFPRFLAGEPLGDLFLSLRREFLEKHHNPLGLLYAVYCDGDTRVRPGIAN